MTRLPATPAPEPMASGSEAKKRQKGRVEDAALRKAKAPPPPDAPLPPGNRPEDEAADPVGDGHSDADLAERLPRQDRKVRPGD